HIDPGKRVAADDLEARVAVVVPAVGANPEARVRVTLTTEGTARLQGRSSFEVDGVVPGKEYAFDVRVRLAGYGDGSVVAQAESFDAGGKRLWGRAETLFVLSTPDALPH